MSKRALLACLVLCACGDDSGPPDARPIDSPVPNGTISLTWSISDGGTPLTCAQVHSTLVALVIRPVDQPFGRNDVLSCSPGAGSVPAEPGDYQVTVSLGGVDIAPTVFQNVHVDSGADTPLGEVAFEVQAVGGVDFTIAAGAAGNCGAAGANLSAVQLALATLADVCVPATFDIGAGATQPAGVYATDCTTPAAFPACIESDQTVTARPTIPTGSYRLKITGEVAGTACWTRLPQFDVPAAGASVHLPVQNLTHDDVTPACNL